MLKFSRLLALTACVGSLVGSSAFAGQQDLSVIVPKTAYIEWLSTSGSAMASVNGNNSASFSDYSGGAVTQLTQPSNKVVYLGVMCNSLAGYDLTLTAVGSNATATTGELSQSGATPITYTTTLAQAGGIASGATVNLSLNLVGSTQSIRTSYATEADLPLTAAAPNVFSLTTALPAISSVADGLIMSGTYTGGYIATVVLR